MDFAAQNAAHHGQDAHATADAAVGNRTRKKIVEDGQTFTVDYVYNSLGQLVSDSEGTYEYDIYVKSGTGYS